MEKRRKRRRRGAAACESSSLRHLSLSNRASLRAFRRSACVRATNRQTRTARLRTHEGDRVRPSLNECRFGSRARNGYRWLEICLEEEEEGERTKPRRYLCRPISSSRVETRTLLMFLSLHFLTEPPRRSGKYTVACLWYECLSPDEMCRGSAIM